MNAETPSIATRAALYLRVSTARQAEHDVSIPDQKRQGEAYCLSRGYQLIDTFVEPGASATNDRRPEFQRMIEAGTSKPAPFDIVVVHSFSRFFRDHFELEFYVRKLAKNGVKLVSITQEMGDDPMHVMMRQIMALFDEYQSKENGKHVMRALKENARQGFWNGALPPIGYRIVAAEQRGAKTKKKLEIDPLHADTVRLIYRLALEGNGTSGPMGVKAIVSHLNARRIFTRDGGRWGIGQLHRILTRRTYIGEHEFNKRSKTKELKPVSEIVTVPVPPLIDLETFDAVQAHLKARNPKVTPPRVVSGPTLLTGICFCEKCGGAMTIRTGKGGRYRYYTCSIKARQGETGCSGRSIPMEKLDTIVASHIEDRLLQPDRLEEVLASVLDRRHERAERRQEHIAELNRRAAETDLRLKRLYDAIESGVADLSDPALKDRITGLKALRDQAQVDAERAQAMLESSGNRAVTPATVRRFADVARQRIRIDGGGYRRDHLRAFAQRVEVGEAEVRIMGSKGELLRTLTAVSSGKSAGIGVPSLGLKWRRGWDSNPRYPSRHAAFRVRYIRPLCHLSAAPISLGRASGFSNGSRHGSQAVCERNPTLALRGQGQAGGGPGLGIHALETKQLCGAAAGGRGGLAGGFDKAGALHPPAEVLLVQGQARDGLGGGLEGGQGEEAGHEVEQDGTVLQLAAQAAQARGQDAAVIRAHDQAGRQDGGRGQAGVAPGLGHQSSLVEQFVAFQHPLLVPAMLGRQGEQGADAGQAAVVVPGPGGQPVGHEGGQVSVLAAAIFPWEDVEDGAPAGVVGLTLGRIRGQGQIADGDVAGAVALGRGARHGAAGVAKGVELFDEAQTKAGLGRDEVAQGAFEGAVAHRIERAEGQKGVAVLGLGGQDDRLSVLQRHDDDRQADKDTLTARLRHGYSVCQASSEGSRPTALART